MAEKTPGERYDAAERQARVVDLRRQRIPFHKIGEQLGISRQRAQQLYEEAIQAVKEPSVRAHRAEMLEQLDELEQAALKVLATEHVVVQQGHIVSKILDEDEEGNPVYGEPLIDDAPVLNAIDRLLKIQERRARLVGADAATKVEVESHVDPESIELLRLIKQREQSNQDERKQMIDNSGDPE